MSKAEHSDVGRLDVDSGDLPLERYRPVSLLGHGALGCVYECLDVNLKKTVAVKCLHSVTADRVMSFQNEARIASRLNHESVIRILDFGITDGGKPFMVMEHFDSLSLDELIGRNGRLDEHLATELFLKIAEALKYLHANRVFHRDLKPSNILVSKHFERVLSVRLIDFNLSKTSQDVQSKTHIQGRTVVGTPAYMSPDQIVGIEYDAISEIYSLGCVMYKVLTGQEPFEGETALQVLNKHASEEPKSLQETNEHLSAKICAIVDKTLRKRREERYQSISELIADLRQAPSSDRNDTPGSGVPEITCVSEKQTTKHLSAYIIAAVMIVAGASVLVPLLFKESAQKLSLFGGEPPVRAKLDSEIVSEASGSLADQFVDNASQANFSSDGGKTALKVTMRFTASDDDVAKFCRNKYIESISIKDSPITDRSISYFASLPNLKHLDIGGSQVRSIEGIEACRKLIELSLNETGVDDAVTDRLSKLAGLVFLRLRHTKITDRGVEKLKPLKSLVELDLGFTQMTDSAIPSLLEHKNLMILDARATKLSYDGCRRLASNLPLLKALNVEGGQISAPDKRRLTEEFPYVSFTSSAESPLEKTYRSAENLRAHGDYQQAIRIYKQCIDVTRNKKFDTIRNCFMGISACYGKLHQPALQLKAMEDFVALSESNHQELLAMEGSGLAFNVADQHGFYDAAEKYGKKILKLTEKLHGAESEVMMNKLISLSDFLAHRRGNYKEAAKHLQRSLAIAKNSDSEGPYSTIAHERYAECLRYEHRHKQAIKHYKEALTQLRNSDGQLPQFLLETYHSALLGLAQSYMELGHMDEALRANEEAYQQLKKFVHHPQVLSCLSQRESIFRSLNDTEAAEKVHAELIANRKGVPLK